MPRTRAHAQNRSEGVGHGGDGLVAEDGGAGDGRAPPAGAPATARGAPATARGAPPAAAPDRVPPGGAPATAGGAAPGLAPPGRAPPGHARQRNAAKAKAGTGRRTRPRRSRSAPASVVDDGEEDVFFDDEEPDVGKTLHAKDGKLGFFNSSKGFVYATNFLVDIRSQVHSEKYVIKGYEVKVKKAGAENWVDFFVPESDIYNPSNFKNWLDTAHLRIRWKLQCNGKAWRDMIEKRLDHFEETNFKEKFLVEKVGVQTQTSSRDPRNLSARRLCLGPDLYFKADGNRDPDPIHYWGNGSLSSKLGAPKLLKALGIEPDDSMDLSALVEAHMPDNFWQHSGTAGFIMSCSNADVVRLKAKQHPCLVLLGPMGIGKSSCQDVCMWNLCGSKEVSKIDSDTRNTTVKRLAAMKTFPTTIEDNSSENKEENLTNACFDQATYHVKGEEVFIETPFVLTTNLESRSERAGDREVLVLFEVSSASPEEMIAAERMYEKAMRSKTIPIGSTIKYGSFVLTQEYDDLLAKFTAMQMDINGCKKRTARGYALKDVAVYWTMKTNPEVYARLGRAWDGDDQSYCHYLRTKQKDAIRTYHMELTRAGPICIRYLENALMLASTWDMTQRLRSFAVVVSKKHRDWKKCKYCVAVKLDSPHLKNCGGVTMELVQKVIDVIGGVNNAVCASFLSQLEVYDEDIGLVSKVNTQQHRCLLFPIADFLNSALILKIASVLDNPNLCQLADEETPTSTSGNLGTSGRGDEDDEVEDYNDISMLLVNGPVNSTQVESSTASSHPNIELSRIGGPDPGDVAGDHGVGDFELSRIGGPDPGDVAGDHGVGDQEPVEGGEQEHRTSLESEDMVLTGAVGGGSSSTLQGQFRCHCGKECTSKYGLTKHIENCSRPADVSKSVGFPCPVCQKVFGEERYLKQHQGGKKCETRRAFLEKTASFTLALTDSPGSVRDASTGDMVVCSFCRKACKNVQGLSRHLKFCKVKKTIDSSASGSTLVDATPTLVPDDPTFIATPVPTAPTLIVDGLDAAPRFTAVPAPTLVAASPTLVAASPTLVAASPTLVAASSTLVAASSILVAASSTLGSVSDTEAVLTNVPVYGEVSEGSQSGNVVACCFCNKIFKRKGIGSHMKFCKGKKDPLSRIVAERRLSTSLPPQAREDDMAGGASNVVHQCSKCEVQLKTVQALKTHERFCKGKPTPQPASRRLSTTLPVNNANMCTVCGDIVSTPTGLKVHMLTHRKPAM